MKPLRFLVPFTPVFVIATVLYFIGDQYPFSNFPMYSNLPHDADGVFVTNQKDEIVPMLPTFGVSSQTSKKMFMRELKKTLEPRGTQDPDKATPEEIKVAAQKVLDELVRRGRPHRFGASKRKPEEPDTSFTFNRRLYIREGSTLRFEDVTHIATATL